MGRTFRNFVRELSTHHGGMAVQKPQVLLTRQPSTTEAPGRGCSRGRLCGRAPASTHPRNGVWKKHEIGVEGLVGPGQHGTMWCPFLRAALPQQHVGESFHKGPPLLGGVEALAARACRALFTVNGQTR